MGSRDPRVDAYIARAAEFARPVLTHIRELVHDACPDVEETLKWSMPHFEYHGLMCGMAAFKAHCTLGFWKGRLIVDGAGQPAQAAMGQFGRITSIDDLPPARVLKGYVKQAMRLNEAGEKAPPRVKRAKPAVVVPDDLVKALARQKAARTTFDAFPESQRREYVDWITGAKGADTRARRIATTVEWLSEGKRRNWKYENC